MILKGNQRGFGQELARHLMNVEDNEHAVVHELRGFMADDLSGAFKEAEAISFGTKCQQYLYSLSLNPPPSARVSVEGFEKAIEEIERRLGLTGQPRAIVFHEKKGRRHAHCVWSRIDVTRMRAIDLPHTKLRLQDISRELFREHGWDMPKGLREPKDRSQDTYSGAEAKQAARAKQDPAVLKKLFKSCWTQSDSRAAFAAALWQRGFCLARGDRRGFVAVDAEGEVYSLSRWLGVKPKELRARLGKEQDLPDVSEAQQLFARAQTLVPETDGPRGPCTCGLMRPGSKPKVKGSGTRASMAGAKSAFPTKKNDVLQSVRPACEPPPDRRGPRPSPLSPSDVHGIDAGVVTC